MREGRPRAVRSGLVLLPSYVAAVLCVIASAGGCATEVNTLEPGNPQDEGENGGTSAEGGSAAKSMAGNPAAAGSKPSGGSGGTGVSAFGGTTTTGGKPAGGAGGTAGADEPGGAGGAPQGGMMSGGAGGNAGTAGGGTAGGGNAGSAGGNSLGCLNGWKGSACDSCSTQTQSDKLACVTILDCYAANACGPATCANNDDKCGANKIGQGTAGYPIAKQVYDCACP